MRGGGPEIGGDDPFDDTQQQFVDRYSSKQPLGDFAQTYMSPLERATGRPVMYGGMPDLLLVLVDPRFAR